MLVKDMVGGNSFCSIIATVNQDPQFINETISTLTFIMNAKGVNRKVSKVTGKKKEIKEDENV